VSALVIPAKGELKAFPPHRDDGGDGLMHSYHNVANLQQHCGIKHLTRF
jgi:hypothetical protein